MSLNESDLSGLCVVSETLDEARGRAGDSRSSAECESGPFPRGCRSESETGE